MKAVEEEESVEPEKIMAMIKREVKKEIESKNNKHIRKNYSGGWKAQPAQPHTSNGRNGRSKGRNS